MSKFKDLTGKRFGRLVVIGRSKKDPKKNHHWDCICDCGNKITVYEYSLTKEHGTRSCGCLRNEPAVNRIDLTGKKFGKLTVIKFDHAERIGTRKSRQLFWLCECECGKRLIVCGGHLRSGHTKSCGCVRYERLKEYHEGRHQTALGLSHTKIYKVWLTMIHRCFDKDDPHYGGRGIKVCDEWSQDNGFAKFYNFVSKLPHFGEDGYSLDRIDVNGNYEPNNIRWADKKTQARNRNNSYFIEYHGKMIPVTELLKITYELEDLLKFFLTIKE